MRRALIGVLGATAIAISGCGTMLPGQTSAEAPAQSSSPAAPPEPDKSTPAQESAPEQDSAAPTSVKMTAPGTQLKIGERAVVPSRKGPIGITVTAVKAGDPAELQRQYGERAKGITPWFIRFRVENVDGADHSFSSSPLLSPVTADGRGTGAVLTGSLGDCKRESAPKDFAQAGAKFMSCRLTGARPDVEIVGAKFDNDDYREDPVVWRS
ncbi:hypothetical protein ABZ897_22860 [Nonomuraea sp. NPDC046802]|uniref:hypothetical protein n=1 Tax=Nonomuraea sp. NPDC046802 TaxID=3154919 RepID=UPI0033D27FD5